MEKWDIRSLLRWLCTGLMGVVCLITVIRLLPELLLGTADYGGYYYVPTIYTFSRWMLSFGVEKTYALDGGQTATIVMRNKLMNKPDHSAERKISDIIYFATAIPSE